MRLRALAVVALFGLTACSGGTGSTASTPSTDRPTTSRVSTAPSPTAVLDGFAECADPTGDSSGNGDLVSVTLGTQGPVLLVQWTTSASLPTSQTLWSVTAGNYQLGLKQVDAEIFRFVFDLRTAKQANLTSSYSIDGPKAFNAFPLAQLTDLAAPFEYTATVSIDGTDTDSCKGTFR